MGVSRGCGTRVAGGIYATMGLSATGHPMEEWMFDPAKPISKADWANLGLSNIGVKAVNLNGIVHLFDIVGESFYPNVADFLEEAGRIGMSRRLPSSLPWSQIGPASRLVILHNRAVIGNPEVIVGWEDVLIGHPRLRQCVARTSNQHCDRRREEHPLSIDLIEKPCSRLWWQDVEGGVFASPEEGDESAERPVLRKIGDVSYHAFAPPGGVKVRRSLGIVGMFPIHRLEVVRDAAAGRHEEVLPLVRKSRLSVSLEDE